MLGEGSKYNVEDDHGYSSYKGKEDTTLMVHFWLGMVH
jgi:hypothetical protein